MESLSSVSCIHMLWMIACAGFVTILGSPNVGKSTLMNALVGERVSIVSPKQQTTRHQIMGVVSTS